MSQLVTIRYNDLLDHKADLNSEIEQAFGYNALGIIVISDVPNLHDMRQKLLSLAPCLAALPDDVLSKYEDPDSTYNLGWSHGKEKLQNGLFDTHKGSFYANPVHNTPTEDRELMTKYPEYYRPNIWPSQELPELESVFMSLAGVIVGVGQLLLHQCDRYVHNKYPGAVEGKLQQVVRSSRIHKARLLHYFPVDSPQEAEPTDHSSTWCAWHTDHGSLTGLLSALYVKDGCRVSCPDPGAGLYIRTRKGEVFKVAIPEDHLAFQVGEAMQVHSGGLLQATPHYVRAACGAASTGISRNTLAVFMQPDVFEVMDTPPGVIASDVAVGQWEHGQTFGEFSKATIDKYYK